MITHMHRGHENLSVYNIIASQMRKIPCWALIIANYETPVMSILSLSLVLSSSFFSFCVIGMELNLL